jgi:hypothetical protein
VLGEIKMSDQNNIEALAAVEHESWSGWWIYQRDRQRRELAEFERSYNATRFATRTGLVDAFDSLDSTQRWNRQAATPYAELPEKEKESDRIEARKKLKVYQPQLGVHLLHGRGDDAGPDDEDCPCRGTPTQTMCADMGCGFCVAAEQA